MAKIRKDEIIEQGDPFDDARKGAEGLLSSVAKLKEEFKELLSGLKEKITTFSPKTTEEIKKFNEQATLSEQVIKELTKLKKNEIAIEAKRQAINSNIAKQNRENNELLKEERKVKRLAAREAVNLVGAYERESRELNNLRKQYKNLIVEQGKESKQSRALLKDITRLDKKLKEVDASVGQNQRNVGNYTGALDKLKGSFRNLAQAAGLTVGIFGAFRVLKESIGLVREFEKETAVLAGVLGKTREETVALRDDALRLGESTAFTAREVTELQIAYARLGFTQNEILASTEATLNGALALQADLGDTANLVGATLRAFNLDASESGRVVDVLTSSTQNSALNFEKLNTAIGTVAPVAANANISLESTVGLLGTIVDRGVDASTAATSLRNIFLTLAKEGISLDEALDKIANSTDKNSAALELFDKRSVTTAVILAQNRDSVNELTGALEGSAGAAEKLAEEQLNTLDGALKLLKSAWEGYILNLNDSTKAGNFLTKGLKFLGKNLKATLDFLGKLVAIFIAFKVAVALSTAAIRLNAISVSLLAKNAKGAIGGLRGLITNFKALNSVMKANVIGLVAAALTALYFVLRNNNSEVEKSLKFQEDLNEVNDRATKIISEEKAELDLLLKVARDENQSKEDRLKAIKDLNDLSPEYLGNLTLETINTDAATAAIKRYNEALKIRARSQAVQEKQLELQKELIELEQKPITEQERFEEGVAGNNIQSVSSAQLAERVNGAITDEERDSLNAADLAAIESASDQNIINRRTAEIRERIAALDDYILTAQQTGKIDLFGDDANTGSGNSGDDNVKKALTQLKKYQEELKETNELRERLLKSPEGRTDQAFVKATESAEELKLKIRELQEVLNFKGDVTDQKISEQLLKDEIEFNNDRIDEEIKFQEEQAVLTGKFLLNRIQKEIDSEYELQKELLKIKREFALQGKTDSEKELINLQFDAKVRDLEKKKIEREKKVSDSLVKIVEDREKKKTNVEENAEKLRVEKQKELLDSLNALGDEFARNEQRRLDEKLRLIDEEIAASQRREDTLRALAAQGSEDATQNLAFEQKKQAELQAEKTKQIQKQKQTELGLTALKAFTARLDSDKPDTALPNTIRDILTLSNFIGSLSTFWEGTENVGKALGKPQLQGRDGHIIRVDGVERIVDGDNNKKIGSLSNDELADVAYNYNNGLLTASDFTPTVIHNNQWSDNKQVLAKFDKLEKAVKSIQIPQVDYQFDKIEQIVTQVVKSKNKEVRTSSKLRGIW